MSGHYCASTALPPGNFHRSPSDSEHLDTGASPEWSQRIDILGWESNPIQGVRNQELINNNGSKPPTKLWKTFFHGCEKYYYLHCYSSDRK